MATGAVERSAALLFGRVTYDLLKGYWRGVAASGQGRVAEVRFARALEGKPKYLVSRDRAERGWNTTVIGTGDLGEEISSLKDSLDGDLLLIASPSLAKALTDRGLIDEYLLAIQPILAGRGPVFLAGIEKKKLRLTETSRFPSGVAIHRYKTG